DVVSGLDFSAHGQHFVYSGLREIKRFAVMDTQTYGPWDDLRTVSKVPGPQAMFDVFEISSDGSRVGFIGKRGEEWFVNVDGTETGPYSGCAGLAISPEGSRV